MSVNTGPMTTTTGRWVKPTNLDPTAGSEVHVVTDGHPVCDTWINYRILVWDRGSARHGAVAELLTCEMCKVWLAEKLTQTGIAEPELPADPTGVDCAERYEGVDQ